MIERIQWQGHGSFVIEGDPCIQIAPWRVVKREAPPDVILVGHDHYDHCSPADIQKIRGEDTVVIGNAGAARVIEGAVVLREWQGISVERANVKAVPAYSPRDPRHPPEAGGLGFLISLDFFDIYYVGDSELIPEMAHVKPDIALLPIDGYGRLSVEQALRLLDMMQPRWAIPYNWGGSGEEATQLDAQSFQSRAGAATEVILLPLSP